MPSGRLALLTIGASLILAAQTPLYDVASVRQNNSGSHSGDYKATPNGFKVTNLPLRFLIVIAFHTREGLIFDLPPWAAERQFDLTAKVDLPGDKPLTEAQQKAMLAGVLADRFHLKLHTETKQLPVYNLVVAAGGSRLKVSESPTNSNWTVGDTELNATSVQIPNLVNMLSDTLDRNVIDQTGLTGTYDIHLHWTPDHALDSDNGKPAQDPPLFTALKEQLGLRLVPSKGPVETLVVDHVEQPTEN